MKNFGKRTDNLDFANIGDIPTNLSQLTNDVGYLTSHQNIKSLNTNNTAAQPVNASEAIAGSGTINLHKVAKTGSYNDLLNKPTIPSAPNNGVLTIQKNGTTIATFGANQSDNKTANITVPVKVSELTNDSGYTSNTGTVLSVAIKMNGSTKGTVTTSGTIDLGTVITDVSSKLDKVTFEYNKELSCSYNGKVCLGKFSMYDTNLTIEITSTTNTTFSGTLVIATQNINNSHGGTYKANVYGDATGTLSNVLTVIYPTNSRWFEIYCNFEPWSKNLVHIKAVNLYDGEFAKDILINVSSIPTANKIPVVNVLENTYAKKDDIPKNYLVGGSQTQISSEDSGSNIFTFTKADGTTAEFTVKNGSKGSTGDNGKDGLNALVYNNIILVDSIPNEESKGNIMLNSNDFNRLPYPDETFWVIMSDDSGAEEAVQFSVDSYGSNTETVSCGWLNRRNIKGEQGERGDDGVGISTATTGTPTVGTDGYTTTPITFKKTDNSTILVNVKAKNGKDGTDATITSINGLQGGMLTSPLIISGGDGANAAKLALNQNGNGQITDSATSTIFGFMSAAILTVGSASYILNLRGKNTRPTYNNNALALQSDIPTVNNGKLTIKQGGVEKGTFTANQSGNVEIDLESGGASYITYTAIYMSYSGAVDIMDGNPIEDFFCKLWISPLCTSDAFTMGSDFLSWLGANTFADETSALACNGYSPQLGVACACWNDGSNILYVEFSNGQVVMLYDDSITISSNSFSAYL